MQTTSVISSVRPQQPVSLTTRFSPSRLHLRKLQIDLRCGALYTRAPSTSKSHERKLLEQQLRRQLTGVGCRVVLRRDLDYIRSRNVEAAQATQ